jgi:excisionase family DNA binding protein
MALTKTGGHFRATDEDTVELVRRLAAHYDDSTIALILSRQHRRTGTGLPFTKSRVQSLRVSRAIPADRPPETVAPGGDDAVVVTVAEAERLLGVSKVTIYRWLRDGFITGEQLTVGAPWRIRIDHAVRDKVVPTVPDGWVGLDEAASILGVARQTVLHKVHRGELQAVHVNRGQRKGYESRSPATRLDCLINPHERNAQCYSVPGGPRKITFSLPATKSKVARWAIRSRFRPRA